MMGNEAEILYCIVFEHLYSTSPCSKPTKALKGSD